MQTLWLKHDFKEAAAELKAQFPHPENANCVLAEDCKVIAPDGTITAVLLRNVIPPELYLRSYKLLKTVNGLISNRASAMGTLSLARSVNTNGVVSPRRGVNKLVLDVSPARQGILGWDRPGHLTMLTRKRPEMLEGNRALIELADGLYAEQLPIPYAKQRASVARVPWRLWGTSFTTVYASKNFRSAYHRDGNVKGTMTAITPLGMFSGGELILLRWRVAIPYKPGDLLLFDAEELHGNLPFQGERMSMALFCARPIAKCDK